MFATALAVGAVGCDSSAKQALSDKEITTKDADKVKALNELSKLALNNVGSAQGRLAQEYYDGVMVKRDDEKAKYWAESGYKLKDPLATILLAKMNYYGESIPKDQKKAMALLNEVKDKSPDAQYLLARMYLNDPSGDNLEKGQALLKDAADNGQSAAQFDFARQLLTTSQSIDVSVDAKAQKLKDDMAKKATEYLAMAVTQGYAPATTYLALCFYNGVGVNKSPKKAKDLMALAKDMGDKEAAVRLERDIFTFNME